MAMWSKRNMLKSALATGAMASLPTYSLGTGVSARRYRIPDEAEPHEITFMQYPVSRVVYDDALFLEDVQRTIADIANTISEFEPVIMMMDKRHQDAARGKFSNNVEFWDIPTEDLWARDAVPLFGVDSNKELLAVNLNFNGWGNRQVHKNDGKVAERLAAKLGIDLIDSGLVGEAGGVEYNGEGLLLAHESSWVNPNRNRGSRASIEAKLLDAFKAEKVIWAEGLYDEDITDYHIDSLARLVGEEDILIQLPEEVDPNDPFAIAAYETNDVLRAAVNLYGRKFNFHIVPEPTRPRVKSYDFVASYANYYICNGGVIAAQFGDKKTDGIAREVLQDLFPSREVVTLNVDALGEIGGGIHCATHELPKV